MVDMAIASPRPSLLSGLPQTRFGRLRRPQALASLLLTLVTILVLLGVGTAHHAPASAPTASMGDMAMYGRIVERMQGGEGYYPAAHAELVAGDYGTRSVFNWRLPTLFFLVSRLPSVLWAQIGLGIAAIGAALLAFRLMDETAGAGNRAAAGGDPDAEPCRLRGARRGAVRRGAGGGCSSCCRRSPMASDAPAGGAFGRGRGAVPA